MQRRIGSKREDHPHRRPKRFQKNHRPQRDYSNLRCFTCDEKGHFARDCPRNKGFSRTNKRRKHHAHIVEEDERKRIREDSSSDEKYVLITARTGTVTHGSNDWLIDS